MSRQRFQTEMFHVRLTPKVIAGLRLLSEYEEQSMSDIVRQLIETRLEETK